MHMQVNVNGDVLTIYVPTEEVKATEVSQTMELSQRIRCNPLSAGCVSAESAHHVRKAGPLPWRDTRCCEGLCGSGHALEIEGRLHCI